MEPKQIQSNLEKEIDIQWILSKHSIQSIQNRFESKTVFFPDQIFKDQTEAGEKRNQRKPKSNLYNSTEWAEQFEQFRISVGSQPCTCFYPDHPSIPKFELGTDEFSKNVFGLNGTGPETCHDLKALGYTFEGFYMVRFNSNRVKAILCNFKNETIQNTKNGNGHIEASINETSISC